MLKKVLRYSVAVRDGVQQVYMPVNSKIVYVDSKTLGFIDIWAECDSEEAATKVHNYEVYGTGHNIAENAEHVGTVMNRSTDHDGLMATAVWHLYERTV